MSSMAALLLENALAGPSFLIAPDAVTMSDERGEFVKVGDVLPDSPKLPPQLREKPRVPPETPEPEPRAEVVERLQQQVPGVRTASTAFPSVPQDLARQVTPRPRRG